MGSAAVLAVAVGVSPTANRIASEVFASANQHAGRVRSPTSNHSYRPQDARVPAAPALLAHVAGGAGIRLRLSGLPRCRAHAGPRPAVAQRGPRHRPLREDLLGEKAGAISGFSCAPGPMPRKTSSASTPAAGWAFTPSPPARSARCSTSSSASPGAKGSTRQPREVKDEALQKCILIGFSDRVARRLDSAARCAANWFTAAAACWRAKAPCRHSPLFVAAEIREVEGKDKEVNTHSSPGHGH